MIINKRRRSLHWQRTYLGLVSSLNPSSTAEGSSKLLCILQEEYRGKYSRKTGVRQYGE